MEINSLIQRPGIQGNEKLAIKYKQFELLLEELNTKGLSDEVVVLINEKVDQLNALSDSDSKLKKTVHKGQSRVIQVVAQQAKIVPQNYYRNLWLALGMSAFGIPLGVVVGTMTGNMGLLGLGLPFGMLIGIIIGSGLDKKASEEGRQLKVELRM